MQRGWSGCREVERNAYRCGINKEEWAAMVTPSLSMHEVKRDGCSARWSECREF